MTIQLLTPCCNAPIDPVTEWGGHTVGEQVVGFGCSNCFNEWDRDGAQTYAAFVPEAEQADTPVSA